MRILIVNQVFYPDEVAVSQYLTDFAEDCTDAGHKINVIAGNRNYEKHRMVYPPADIYKGITIRRIYNTGFSKSSKLGRLMNFISFNINLFFTLLFIKRRDYDFIFGSTVPPMIAVITSICANLKRIQFILWVMDLQPDEAIAAGYLKQRSLISRIVVFLGLLPLRRAKSIIVLDKYMKERVIGKGIIPKIVHVCAIWPVQEDWSTMASGGIEFRKAHGFGNKFIIMYSGNHSICHPFYTLLDVTDKLKNDPRFLFVFIGGGVRSAEVSDKVGESGPTNIVQLPYQPRAMLAESLCSADVHIVIMGNEFVGIVHPSKIYGTMACGRPTVFIGPDQCHVADFIRQSDSGFIVSHGDSKGLEEIFVRLANMPKAERDAMGKRGREYIYSNYSRNVGTKKIISLL